jgi:hypothetical protein
MILYCSFEEIQALTAGAERVLARAGSGAAVAAPSEAVAGVETLLERLPTGVTLPTLAEQRRLRLGMALIRQTQLEQMEDAIRNLHPAAEEAVTGYFDYAHTVAALERLEVMGHEMAAIIEVITGAPVTPESAASVSFTD